MCVCVCIHLPSQRRKTRIRGGGESEEALSLSVRLFLTAAISLIRLWRNRNLALHRPGLPLYLSTFHSLTPPIRSLSSTSSSAAHLSIPEILCISFTVCCRYKYKTVQGAREETWCRESERLADITYLISTKRVLKTAVLWNFFPWMQVKLTWGSKQQQLSM